MTKSAAIIAAILISGLTFAEGSFPAPFGLEWSMSEGDLAEIGFSRVRESDGINVLASVSVPKAWSRGETYLALVYNDALVKVTAASKGFTKDLYGTKGKDAYDQVKAILTEKYGTPAKHQEFVGNDLYTDANEFYQCLSYTGCGVYATMFKFSGGYIVLALEGKGRAEGFLSITYESLAFDQAKKAIERAKEKEDVEAF